MSGGNVRLKNNMLVSREVVKRRLEALQKLHRSDYVAFYELVECCRNPRRILGGGVNEARLGSSGLVERIDDSGCPQVSELTRAIVLLSVRGDDFGMRVISPVQGR